MSTSQQIRDLADEGLAVGDIARRLGIRYQHAYNVLKRRGPTAIPRSRGYSAKNVKGLKPVLTEDRLIDAGFTFAGSWILTELGELTLDRPVTKSPGVYAVVKSGTVMYVGVASIGLAKRIRFYCRPGPRQKTSQRLNALLSSETAHRNTIQLFTAFPPDLE